MVVYEVEDVLGQRVVQRLEASLLNLSALRAKFKKQKFDVFVPLGLEAGVRFSDGSLLQAYSHYAGRRILAFRVIDRESALPLSVDKRAKKE